MRQTIGVQDGNTREVAKRGASSTVEVGIVILAELTCVSRSVKVPAVAAGALMIDAAFYLVVRQHYEERIVIARSAAEHQVEQQRRPVFPGARNGSR